MKTEKQFQKMIDETAKHQSRFYDAQFALMKECEVRYGCTPSDVDCDEIIDLVLGGSGGAVGMTFKAFDAAMKEAITYKYPNGLPDDVREN